MLAHDGRVSTLCKRGEDRSVGIVVFKVVTLRSLWHHNPKGHNPQFWCRETFKLHSLCLQTSSEAQPASYPMGTWCLYRGKARPGRDADHSFYLVPRLRMSRSYNPLPLVSAWRRGTAFAHKKIKIRASYLILLTFFIYIRRISS
jgi:hypothetical protein